MLRTKLFKNVNKNTYYCRNFNIMQLKMRYAPII